MQGVDTLARKTVLVEKCRYCSPECRSDERQQGEEQGCPEEETDRRRAGSEQSAPGEEFSSRPRDQEESGCDRQSHESTEKSREPGGHGEEKSRVEAVLHKGRVEEERGKAGVNRRGDQRTPSLGDDTDEDDLSLECSRANARPASSLRRVVRFQDIEERVGGDRPCGQGNVDDRGAVGSRGEREPPASRLNHESVPIAAHGIPRRTGRNAQQLHTESGKRSGPECHSQGDVGGSGKVHVADARGAFTQRLERKVEFRAEKGDVVDPRVTEGRIASLLRYGRSMLRGQVAEVRCEDDVPRGRGHGGQQTVVLGILGPGLFELHFDADGAGAKFGQGTDHQRVEIPVHRPAEGGDGVVVDVDHSHRAVQAPGAAQMELGGGDAVFQRVQKREGEDAGQNSGEEGECADDEPLPHYRLSQSSGFCFSRSFQSSKWSRGPSRASPLTPS